MTIDTELSFVKVAEDCGVLRDAPLPPEFRDRAYNALFDFDTLFYDVYRCGNYTVLQGPPLFNFQGHLEETAFHADFIRNGGVVIDRSSGVELWLKGGPPDIRIEGRLGRVEVRVQPELGQVFRNKRVLFTLSKDNDVQWIKDWVQFHVRIHGADAVLLYDNASTAYGARELEAELERTFPGVTIRVVNWPFRFGPRVWRRRDASGNERRISSKFCQAGALQHARFRFLQKARSVLNCDIDELVLPSRTGGSVFRAAETSLFGAVHFRGRWIGDAGAGRGEQVPRHADFARYDASDKAGCPLKWAVVPWRCTRAMTWSAHRVKGLENYFTRSSRFAYGHFSEITTNWKYNRTARKAPSDAARYRVDEALLRAMQTAGLQGTFQPA